MHEVVNCKTFCLVFFFSFFFYSFCFFMQWCSDASCSHVSLHHVCVCFSSHSSRGGKNHWTGFSTGTCRDWSGLECGSDLNSLWASTKYYVIRCKYSLGPEFWSYGKWISCEGNSAVHVQDALTHSCSEILLHIIHCWLQVLHVWVHGHSLMHARTALSQCTCNQLQPYQTQR